tara:strand:- start:390 stop:1046 length:657 start_codon:yes stop_codon:yes gene_type:complete
MNQLLQSLDTSAFAKEIMRQVDRRPFYLTKEEAYSDKPSVFYGGQTISAPHMHAKAIEYLSPVLKPGNHILDIGSGSGYLTTCFAKAVTVNNENPKDRGKVIGIDVVPESIEKSRKVVNQYFPELLKYNTYNRHFQFIEKDGKYGHPKQSNDELYDGIHIGAASDNIPYDIFTQLARGGFLVLPLKTGSHHTFTIIHKDHKGNISIQLKETVNYVPLV